MHEKCVAHHAESARWFLFIQTRVDEIGEFFNGYAGRSPAIRRFSYRPL
jgi:hypothetical protein